MCRAVSVPLCNFDYTGTREYSDAGSALGAPWRATTLLFSFLRWILASLAEEKNMLKEKLAPAVVGTNAAAG